MVEKNKVKKEIGSEGVKKEISPLENPNSNLSFLKKAQEERENQLKEQASRLEKHTFKVDYDNNGHPKNLPPTFLKTQLERKNEQITPLNLEGQKGHTDSVRSTYAVEGDNNPNNRIFNIDITEAHRASNSMRSSEKDLHIETGFNQIPKILKESESKINRATVYFEHDKHNEFSNEKTQNPDASIKRMVLKLYQTKGVVLDISGHTDTSGDKDYNQKLSEKRVEFVLGEINEAIESITKQHNFTPEEAKKFKKEIYSRITFDVSAEGENNLAKNTPDGTKEVENRRVELTFKEDPNAKIAGDAISSTRVYTVHNEHANNVKGVKKPIVLDIGLSEGIRKGFEEDVTNKGYSLDKPVNATLVVEGIDNPNQSRKEEPFRFKFVVNDGRTDLVAEKQMQVVLDTKSPVSVLKNEDGKIEVYANQNGKNVKIAEMEYAFMDKDGKAVKREPNLEQININTIDPQTGVITKINLEQAIARGKDIESSQEQKVQSNKPELKSTVGYSTEKSFDNNTLESAELREALASLGSFEKIKIADKNPGLGLKSPSAGFNPTAMVEVEEGITA